METVAVVCDDNIECAEARDEALCRTGADKYNPIAYAMTALMCLIYVVLKLVWFFHLQHQPVGDEEDDMEMEKIDTNLDQEVNISTLFLMQYHEQSLSGNEGGSLLLGLYQMPQSSEGVGQNYCDD